MLLTISGIAILVIAFLLFEIRLSKPDHIVLYEAGGIVKRRRYRFYPRHFSLTISGKVHSNVHTIEAEARGRIPIHVKLAVTVAASPEHLAALIRVGGWNKDAVVQATKELDMLFGTFVSELTEKYTIEDISTEQLTKHLSARLKESEAKLGLEIITVSVQAVEPTDSKIREAIRQRESARIYEHTEAANQAARVTAAKAKTDADEKIARFEHDLQLKKIALKKDEEEQDAELARFRVEEEMKLKNMQLDVEKKEIELLTRNPELLVLTPQIAQLAEASQNLRNARTVVSLSSKDLAEGSQFVNVLKTLLQNVAKSIDKKDSQK